jgi:small GTP-binding protein
MLGDTFTGKTSLVLRFAEGYYRDSARSATVGAFFITKRLSVQGMTCKVQIWDTAGQEQFRKLAPMYYKNAAAAIVCYDITSPKSFETLKFWIDELQRNVPAGRIVMAMCATKCDLSITPRPDTTLAEELAQETGAMFLTTSAKHNENVTLLFEQVAERVLQFQKQNSELNIPVRLATTAIETPKLHHQQQHPSNSNYMSTSNSNNHHPNNQNGHHPALESSQLGQYADSRISTNSHKDSAPTTPPPQHQHHTSSNSQQEQEHHYQNQQIQQHMFQQERTVSSHNNKAVLHTDGNNSTSNNNISMRQRSELEDNIALNPTDSSADPDSAQCDTSLLMCGDNLLKASEVASSYSQSCAIL